MSFWINNVIKEFSDLGINKIKTKLINLNKFCLIKDDYKLFIINKQEYKMIAVLIQDNGEYDFLLQNQNLVDYVEILNDFVSEFYLVYNKEGRVNNEKDRNVYNNCN